MTQRGNLFVVAAPSGAGKHTVINAVLAEDENLVYAVSATTRDPREGERDGIHYHFLDVDEFRSRIDAEAFVEWAEVHGNYYGTLKEELEKKQSSGKDVVMQMDVQGVRNLREAGIDFVSIFIMPPSFAELERRLRARGTDGDDDLDLRLRNACTEFEARGEFDHVVTNDVIEQAVADFREVVNATRRKSR